MERARRWLELADVALSETMHVRCSQCDVIKGQTNHWHIAWWSGTHFHTKAIMDDPAMMREDGVFIVCGDNCAHKVYQQFLDYLRNTQA